jgi:hypothetical protein
VALPLAVNRLFAPLMVVGIAIDRTKVPLEVYSSRKTGAALLFNAVLPSPTLYRTRFPGAKDDANGVGFNATGCRTGAA